MNRRIPSVVAGGLLLVHSGYGGTVGRPDNVFGGDWFFSYT